MFPFSISATKLNTQYYIKLVALCFGWLVFYKTQ